MLFESFRDPLGKVVLNGEDVWRIVRARDALQVNSLLDLQLLRDWQHRKKIIDTTHADGEEVNFFKKEIRGSVPADSDFKLFRHRRIEFPSFPYEWSPAMLFDAGKMTLEIAETFFARSGWSIKDASPFNVLFEGPNPIFIDILSFEKRGPLDPIWLPYNQFVRSFLLPLLVNREVGLSLRSIFLSSPDGVAVSDAAKLFGKLRKLKPTIFSLVTLPDLLSKPAEGDSGLYRPKELDSPEKARFVLGQSFRRLKKQLKKFSPTNNTKSNWTEYTRFNQETLPEYMRAKQEFLSDALRELRPRNVLDVGCNTGFFSFMAAREGANVVAIDHDEAVIDRVYRTAKTEQLRVLPLVVNLSRPTPRLGWRYSENPSFLDRSIGRFDVVLMLAVVHHMLVQERIPLREVMKLAADLTRDGLVVEFVPPRDKMFKRLARGRDHLHLDLTPEKFLAAADEFFHVVRSENLPQSDRQIFLMKKK